MPISRTVYPDDQQLSDVLTQVAEGDEPAFARLYRQTSPRLFGCCVRILGDGREAEEALQETYLSVWRRAGTYDPARGSASAWLLTVCRNSAIDHLRARRPASTQPLDDAEEVADTAPLAQEVVIGTQEQHRLAECMQQLETGDAHLIRSAFLAGATYSELADRLVRPLGTIKSRIRRALIRLRECLQ